MKKQKDLLEWKSLYEQAIEIRKLAPWGWMSEGDMVGVEHPITKELAFVSVMGAMQETLLWVFIRERKRFTRFSI